jgi:hypothetical protein
MDKAKLKKKAWKIFKIAMFIIAPFLLTSVGILTLPSEAELSAEKMHGILNGTYNKDDFLREYITGESNSRFTSDNFTVIVFAVWGAIALFFIVRGIIRWVARTAAAAVRDADKQE